MRLLPLEPTYYWEAVRFVARRLGTDHCTGVPDFYRDACDEHDIHYRTHRTLFGDALTRQDADKRFRQVIQFRSKLGKTSPMAWWRWSILRLAGRRAWAKGGQDGLAAA